MHEFSYVVSFIIFYASGYIPCSFSVIFFILRINGLMEPIIKNTFIIFLFLQAIYHRTVLSFSQIMSCITKSILVI